MLFTDFTAFKKILRAQRGNLVSLSLLYFSINTNLFADTQLDIVDFRLKKFSMSGVYLNRHCVVKFLAFMLNHMNTLQCLHIQSPFMDISFFTQFPYLKELKISHTNAYFDIFPSIKKLTVENVSGNWMLKFPNVLELKMNFKFGVFLGMYADLVKLIHLKKLTIIDSKIPELNIPTVTILNLKNATICAKRPFRYEENQIRELTLDACSTIDWISDYLVQENTRLNLLSIKNMQLTRKQFQGCENFKLRLINCAEN